MAHVSPAYPPGSNIPSGSADAGNPIKIGGVDSAGKVRQLSTSTAADASGSGLILLPTQSETMLYNGATFDMARTPVSFHTVVATAAGNTNVWVPASGKKFRLQGYVIYLTANATLAVAGIEEIGFQDATASIPLAFSSYVPSALTAGDVTQSSGVVQLGNGYPSGGSNNALNINLGTALATGECRVTVWGTEE